MGIENGAQCVPELQPEVNTALMRKYDQVVQDPDRFIAEFGVRYVALAADRAEVPYLRVGWAILQRGPYWQIWEREKSQPSTHQASSNSIIR